MTQASYRKIRVGDKVRLKGHPATRGTVTSIHSPRIDIQGMVAEVIVKPDAKGATLQCVPSSVLEVITPQQVSDPRNYKFETDFAALCDRSNVRACGFYEGHDGSLIMAMKIEDEKAARTALEAIRDFMPKVLTRLADLMARDRKRKRRA